MLGEIANLAGMVTDGQTRIFFRTSCIFWTFAQHFWLSHPAVKVHGNLGYKDLLASVQGIEKFAVATVQFVERPGRYGDTIGQSVVDLLQRDLRLGAKLDFFGDVSFFRRAELLAQSFDKYTVLSNRT